MTTKQDIIDALRRQVQAFKIEAHEERVGTVLSVGDGIARISGLSDCQAAEMLLFPGDIYGVALNLEEETVGAIVLGDASRIKEGDIVKSTGRILSVPVSDAVIGRVLDPLGNPVDGKGSFKAETYAPIEKIAPGVMSRKPVGVPLHTG